MKTLNTMMNWARSVALAVITWSACLALAFMPAFALAERVKDISQVQGVRGNQLVGYGLVVGLDSSGDQVTQTPFTVQSIKSMLAQLGVNVPPNINPQTKNVAAVMVHAELPPFAKPGQTIDVTVYAIHPILKITYDNRFNLHICVLKGAIRIIGMVGIALYFMQ